MSGLRTSTRLGIGAAVVVAITVAAQVLPVRSWVEATTAWAHELGTGGLVLLVLLHGLLTMLPIPNSWLQLSAGAMFGVRAGFVIGWTGAVLGGALGVLVPRRVAGRMVSRWIASRPRLARLDSALAQSGWTLIVLCRLSPFVPYAGSNYVFGLSHVPFVRLMLITTLCIAPSTLLYAWLGALGAGGREIGPAAWVAMAVGAVITVAAGIAAHRLAESGEDPDGEPATAQ